MKALSCIQNVKELSKKKVLLRVDWNAEVDSRIQIEQTRIPLSFETIKYLREKGASLIIISHFNRPNGEYNLKYSLKNIVEIINERYGFDFKFISADLEKYYPYIVQQVQDLKSGNVIVLENVRFYKDEISNNRDFAKKLSKLADIYVNDAFAASHRKHSSVSAITEFLPSYAGLLLQKEVHYLEKSLNPVSPSVVFFGGAKADTKLQIIYKLCEKYDYVCVGSAIAKPFLHILQKNYGKKDETITDEIVETAKAILSKYPKKIIIPVDVIVADHLSVDAKIMELSVDKIGPKDIIYDIGSKTIELYKKYIDESKTILWNGPLGLFEAPAFKHGTEEIAKKIADRSIGEPFTVAGGGDTLIAIQQFKLEEKFDFVSSGGGAMLEYLCDQNMPGLIGLYK